MSDVVNWLFNNWVVVLIVVGLALAVCYAYATACPECKKFFADTETNKELIDRNTGFKMVTNQEKHKDRQGNVIKTVERQEQVKVVRSTYTVSHRCKFCMYEWNTTETEESTNG